MNCQLPKIDLRWTDEITPLIKAGDRRLTVNGRPLSQDCRILTEANFQKAKAAVNELHTLEKSKDRPVAEMHCLAHTSFGSGKPAPQIEPEVIPMDRVSQELLAFLRNMGGSLSLRSIEWITPQELEVTYGKPGGPYHSMNLKVGGEFALPVRSCVETR